MTQLPYKPENLTIMIVDDHDPIRKAVKRVLSSQSYGEIIECFDGDDAIKVLAKTPVDLIICDIYMRNIDGFGVLDYIRNRNVGCDVPIIIVTGEASKDDIVKAADMGAADYVLKPFQADELEKKVKSTLTKFFSPPPLLKVLRKAERQLLSKDFRGAYKTYNDALKLNPGSMRATHGKAITLERLGKIREAVSLLRKTLESNQSFHKNYGALADLYLNYGEDMAQEAIEAMRQELEINPKQPKRQVQLAKLLLKEGDPIGSIEHYREALKENPRLKSGLMGMAHAWAEANNLDKALYYCKRVRRYHPKATNALEAAIKFAIAAGSPRKAEMLLKDEKNANPSRYDTYVVLARFLVHFEREDEAETVMEDLLLRDSENVQGLWFKGRLHLHKAEFEKATWELAEAAKISPTSEILLSLCEAQIGANQFKEAIETLEKLLLTNQDNGQVLFLMAEAMRKTGQWCKAYVLYRKAAILGADKKACQREVLNCIAEINTRRRRFRPNPSSRAAS